MDVAPDHLKPLEFEASELESLLGKPQLTSYSDGIRTALMGLRQKGG